jgi:SAM-dependent methyltransferase
MEHLERVKREFARQAERFGSAPAINNDALTRRFVDALGRDSEGVVLDIACGPGIVGVSNVTFVEAGAGDLPFPAAAFDAVATRLSIHHFTDAPRVLGEVRRVLRPGGILVLADVVSDADGDTSALHNAIEVLRDPSHVRMLPEAELASLVSGAGFAIETAERWDQPREVEEWLGIVADVRRVAPLRTIMRGLAAAGQHAGIGLSLAGNRVVFIHRWLLLVARKAP